MRRLDRQFDGVAGRIRGLVERELDLVRAAAAVLAFVVPIPAGVERDARGQLGGRIEDFEAIAAPVDAGVVTRALAGLQVEIAFLDGFPLRQVVGLPASPGHPAPVVVAQFAQQLQLEAGCGEQVALRIRTHDFEAGVVARIGAIGHFEQRACADDFVRRPDGALERTRDRAATAFEQRTDNDDLERAGRCLGFVEGDLGLEQAVVVEHLVKRLARFLRQFRERIAEVEVLQRLDRMHVRLHRHACGETIAGGGCAIQPVAFDLEGERFACRECRRRVQHQLHSFGQEFLDAHGVAGRVLQGRVGAEVDAPLAGRHVAVESALVTHVVQFARLEFGACEFAAVGLAQRHEHRLLRAHAAVEVAQDGVDADGFAGAIQVATRPREDIERHLRTAGDGEFGEIERGRVEAQQGVVVAPVRDQRIGGVELVIDHRQAIVVGGGAGQGFALAVAHFDGDVRLGFTRFQRGGVHQHAVSVGAHVQADVADEEHRGVVFAAVVAGLFQHRVVEAGLLHLGDVADRQVADAAFVALHVEREAVRVNRIAVLREFVHRPVPARAVLLEFVEEGAHLLVADLEELDVGFADIDRHHRQAARFMQRQDVALAGEADHRFLFAGIDLVGLILAEGAAVDRHQAALHGHDVSAVGLQVGEAQFLAFLEEPAAFGLGAILQGDRDQFVKALLRDQRLRERQHDRGAAVVGLTGRRVQREVLTRHGRRRGLSLLQLRRCAILAPTASRQRQQHRQRPARPTHDTHVIVPSSHGKPFPLRAASMPCACDGV